MTKTAMPLLLAAGAGALLFMGRKPKSKPSSTGKRDQFAKLVLNSECSEIMNKLVFGDADAWLTNRYHELVDGGMSDPGAISIQLLKDQSNHCPWDATDRWTPLMKALYDQVLAAVNEWHHTKGGPVEA